RRTRSAFDLHRVDLETGAVTLVAKNPGAVVETVIDREHRVRCVELVRAEGGGELRRVPDAGPESPADSWPAGSEGPGGEGVGAGWGGGGGRGSRRWAWRRTGRRST